MKTLLILLALVAALVALPARASTYAPISADAALHNLCPRGGDPAVVGHRVFCAARGVTLYDYVYAGTMHP